MKASHEPEFDLLCDYQIFNRETGQLEPCGEKAHTTLEMYIGSCQRKVPLCKEHHAFVMDSTTGPFTKSKKRHPSDYNWLAMACKVYLHRAHKLDTSYCEPTPETIVWRPKFRWIAGEIHSMDGSPVRQDHGDELEPIERTEEEIHADTSTFDTPIPSIPSIGEMSPEHIETVCKHIMEAKEEYKGKGISPIIWTVGFQTMYRGKPATDKQISAIRCMIAKQPEKYERLFVA